MRAPRSLSGGSRLSWYDSSAVVGFGDDRRSQRSTLVLAFLVAYAWQVLDPRLTGDLLDYLEVVSWVVWAVFLVDFVARLYLSEQRRRCAVSHWYDVALIVLPMLRPLRLLRVLAFARLLNRSASRSLIGRVTTYVAGTAVRGVPRSLGGRPPRSPRSDVATATRSPRKVASSRSPSCSSAWPSSASSPHPWRLGSSVGCNSRHRMPSLLTFARRLIPALGREHRAVGAASYGRGMDPVEQHNGIGNMGANDPITFRMQPPDHTRICWAAAQGQAVRGRPDEPAEVSLTQALAMLADGTARCICSESPRPGAASGERVREC